MNIWPDVRSRSTMLSSKNQGKELTHFKKSLSAYTVIARVRPCMVSMVLRHRSANQWRTVAQFAAFILISGQVTDAPSESLMFAGVKQGVLHVNLFFLSQILKPSKYKV